MFLMLNCGTLGGIKQLYDPTKQQPHCAVSRHKRHAQIPNPTSHIPHPRCIHQKHAASGSTIPRHRVYSVEKVRVARYALVNPECGTSCSRNRLGTITVLVSVHALPDYRVGMRDSRLEIPAAEDRRASGLWFEDESFVGFVGGWPCPSWRFRSRWYYLKRSYLHASLLFLQTLVRER